jgi:hypothetical protein
MFCRLRGFRRIAARYDRLAETSSPASAWPQPSVAFMIWSPAESCFSCIAAMVLRGIRVEKLLLFNACLSPRAYPSNVWEQAVLSKLSLSNQLVTVSSALLESAFRCRLYGHLPPRDDYCVSFRRNIYMTRSFPAS